jgi:molecular chaperone HtpG
MTETGERHEFQAEVKQLLDLMIHSLYSEKDIFLRELVSNASDALDKLRFERLTNPELGGGGELGVRIDCDREKRTISIADNGIGMTRAEVVQNIGTIAKSGTKEFLAAVQQSDRKEPSPELIGQFGVGFYSAFMVAERVTLVTRRAGETSATRWESTGDGSYTLADGERNEPGTTVTLHLKPADAEHGLQDYTDEHVVRGIVQRYSDFVAYPIRMKDETLNSMKAIWDRPKSEVSEEEYREFYKHVSHDWKDPLRTIPIKLEGTIEAYALLYIPSRAPFDVYSREMKRGVQLYVKRVFVLDECRDLMPQHLRFVRGVVDAHDLPLNVSREMLQKDRRIPIIRKQLVKKVYATLDELKSESPTAYLEFWNELGPVLKEGLLSPDEDKTKLLDLLLATSTLKGDEPTVLADYVTRMKPGQEAIYFLTGSSRESIASSPLLEAFADKDYEVLLFSDPVDELWLERAPKFQDKPLVSIARGEVKLGSDDERKQAAEALEEQQKEYADLLSCLRVHLQDDVKEVRLSTRLTSSLACLVGDENDLSPRMQKMLEQLGQKAEKVRRILELNASHPLLPKLEAIFRASSADPRLELYAKLLLGQAHLSESGQVPEPTAFGKALADVMLRAVDGGTPTS